MQAYNSKPILYAPPTPLERMLERACSRAGTPLSAPAILWDPLLPDRLVITRSTPYTPGKSDRLLCYAREYRLAGHNQPRDIMAALLSARLKPVEEAIIDNTVTPYDVLQSTYTAVQDGPDSWELAPEQAR